MYIKSRHHNKLQVLKKEETIREIHTGCQESIARNEDDVKMIQNLEETVCRLQKEITVLNAKVRAMCFYFHCKKNYFFRFS